MGYNEFFLVYEQKEQTMDISITRNKGPIPLTMVKISGKLDGSNYSELVTAAGGIYADGDRNLLLDLSGLTYISSAGIVALHKVAKIFSGHKQVKDDDGWSAYREARRDLDNAPQANLKLASLNSQVRGVLDMTGFSRLFEIYDDLPQAVASFSPPRMEGKNPPATYRSNG
jgi:anti-sigma B factor antagonist